MYISASSAEFHYTNVIDVLIADSDTKWMNLLN